MVKIENFVSKEKKLQVSINSLNIFPFFIGLNDTQNSMAVKYEGIKNVKIYRRYVIGKNMYITPQNTTYYGIIFSEWNKFPFRMFLYLLIYPYVYLSLFIFCILISLITPMKTRTCVNNRNLIIKMCSKNRVVLSLNLRMKIKIFIAKIKTFNTFGKTHETDVISIRSVSATESMLESRDR